MRLTERAKEKKAKVKYCLITNCKGIATSDGYCRLHYLQSWKERKKTKRIDAEGKLNKYIEKLAELYPDNYLKILRKDLSTDADYSSLVESLAQENPADLHTNDEDEKKLIKKFGSKN